MDFFFLPDNPTQVSPHTQVASVPASRRHFKHMYFTMYTIGAKSVLNVQEYILGDVNQKA